MPWVSKLLGPRWPHFHFQQHPPLSQQHKIADSDTSRTYDTAVPSVYGSSSFFFL